MPAPYPSTSIRLRIFFGFTAVIVVLAIANLVATSGLRGLDNNTKKIIDITHFVSQANYFSNAIKQQAGALQAFAYSGLNSDLLRVEASRQETLTHKETLIKRLSQTQSAATIEQIEAANIGFNTVFSSIENRLGNTSSAVNVGLNGLLDMGKSSANLVNFLLTQEEPGTALAQQIAHSVDLFVRTATAYFASGKVTDFDAATQAGDSLSKLIIQAKALAKGVSRREKGPLRFFNRDLDVIRQSIDQHQATALALSLAIEQLRTATNEVVIVTAHINKRLKESQSLALQEMAECIASAIGNSIIAQLAGGAIALIIAALIGTSIAKPIGRMSSAMRQLAEGNKDIDIPYQTKKDELGTLARAASIFKEKSHQLERIAAEKMQAELDKTETQRRQEVAHDALIAEQQERERVSEKARQLARLKQRKTLADGFEQRVIGIVDAVSHSSSLIVKASSAFTANTSQTTLHVDNSYAASGESSQSISQVLEASEELSQSCREVVSELEKNALVAINAVDIGAQTTNTVTELTDAATQIGEVMDIIAGIAEQTNLLALNATIEAARAGDAGKGFAVVAQKVKNLSAQSTSATQNIAKYVDKIQQVSADTANAIDNITGIISQMDAVTHSVVNTMQQQFHATTEITEKVQQVTRGINTVVRSIDVVGGAAEANKAMSENLLTNAQGLTLKAETLDKEARRFLDEIRNNATLQSIDPRDRGAHQNLEQLKHSA